LINHTHDERPNPDALLADVVASDVKSRRGKLKIFFGASAGVGKTYAMLAAAKAEAALGRAVTVGVVETHGRSETVAMTQGLERLPLRSVTYRDKTIDEFNVDAALSFGKQRANALVLVDEFAHTNAPGSRHPKRWQDIEELIAAGVNVWTTLNVQHLASLNDVVGGITGIRVNETVPDRAFDEADEVVVVDLPPDELLRRLQQGKVYLPQQAERAAKHFFRKGNLLALRELALRRTADRVDDEVLELRKQSGALEVSPHREAILACIGPPESASKVIQTASRMAHQLNCEWHVLSVENPDLSIRSKNTKKDLSDELNRAKTEGAITAFVESSDVANAIVRYARQHNLTRVILGRSRRRKFWRNDVADEIAAAAPDLDIVQTAVARVASVISSGRKRGDAVHRWQHISAQQWRSYVSAFAICMLTTVAATPLRHVLDLSSIMLLFLLAVVASATFFGRVAAIVASLSSVLLFNFFFVPPRFSLSVADEQFYVTFLAMLAVGIVIGELTARFRWQARAASRREIRIRGIYGMSRELGGALMNEQVAEVVVKQVRAELQRDAALFVLDANDRLQLLAHAGAAPDRAVAQWAFDRNREAGRGTDTLPSAAHFMLPLRASMRVRGVLAVAIEAEQSQRPETKQWLEACATLAAIALERIHYVDVAQSSVVKIESERLRNSLLAAISHDLRTPLTTTLGMADTLTLSTAALSEEARDMVEAIRSSVLRMITLVNGLLDMARFDAGAVRLNREWQPIDEWVGSAVSALETLLSPRELTIAIDDNVPLLNVDAVLMERVLVNLLENAAKYTPKNARIVIEAHAVGEDAQSEVAISVSDDGPGLPIGDEERLFEKFERGRREDAIAGVGLGLAIARAIVVAHGGRITAKNAEQGGAVFTVYLPRGTMPHPLDELVNASTSTSASTSA
jgi:two-component system, OmpR family, sensor histidine kinase KdpD